MSTLKASAEFIAGVKANWRPNQGAIIPVTVIELEKHAERLGIMASDDDAENFAESEEIGAKIFDLITACNTPEEYIAAFEKEFLNPIFN